MSGAQNPAYGSARKCLIDIYPDSSGVTGRFTMKILIVDDDFEVRETIKNMLVGIALEILSVADAVSALLALKDNGDIHTVITDYRLQGLGGKDWIDLIRHYHPEKNLVVITGYEVAKDKIADEVKVLMKPFTKYQLLEAIGTIA